MWVQWKSVLEPQVSRIKVLRHVMLYKCLFLKIESNKAIFIQGFFFSLSLVLSYRRIASFHFAVTEFFKMFHSTGKWQHQNLNMGQNGILEICLGSCLTIQDIPSVQLIKWVGLCFTLQNAESTFCNLMLSYS